MKFWGVEEQKTTILKVYMNSIDSKVTALGDRKHLKT